MPSGNKERDKNLPGNGVYSSINLSLFAYSHYRPLTMTDPDGDRPLTEGEATILKGIFGSSVDYSKVSINEGSIQGRPYTIGEFSAIQFPKESLSDDYSDSGKTSNMAYGKETLIHEMTHVWQGQNGMMPTIRGIIDHVVANIKGFIKGLFGLGSADTEDRKLYDTSNVKSFRNAGMEQQAQAVEEANTPGNSNQSKSQELLKEAGFPNAKSNADSN